MISPTKCRLGSYLSSNTRGNNVCGIVGICGKIYAKEENIFKVLLCLDTIRGPDSTGVLAVSENSVYETFKKVGTPWNCFGEKKFDNIFKFTNVLLLGHNRMATVGHVTDKNAHPFDVGDIIGVHNGTIRSEFKLEDHQFFDVDSETVLHNFAKNGVGETCKILDGAYAIVFYDKRDHTLHMLRNKERPLYYVYSKDMKTLLWASESWMLTIACAKYDLEIGTITELPPMSEHSFVLPQVQPHKIAALPEMLKTPFVKEEYKAPMVPWSPPKTEVKPHLKIVPKVPADRAEINHFVGKDVLFSVAGAVKSKHQNFLRAYVEMPEAQVVEIRIFMDDKNKKYGPLCESPNKIWEGHVKRAHALNMSKGYLLLDNRSIKPSDPRRIAGIIDSKEKVFNLYHNRPATAQEWLDETAGGCDNCSEIPQMRDNLDLEWYDHGKFFCKNCYNTQAVQNYLSVLTNEA